MCDDTKFRYGIFKPFAFHSVVMTSFATRILQSSKVEPGEPSIPLSRSHLSCSPHAMDDTNGEIYLDELVTCMQGLVACRCLLILGGLEMFGAG